MSPGLAGYPRKAKRFGVGRVPYGAKFNHEFNPPTEDRPALIMSSATPVAYIPGKSVSNQRTKASQGAALILIHTVANFASFFAFRGLSIKESILWRRVWK
jgi:hypothetical protein